METELDHEARPLAEEEIRLEGEPTEASTGLFVVVSVERLRDDIEVCRDSMDLFVQARVVEAEDLLKGHRNYGSSMYLSLGLSTLHFIEAMFTYAPDDVALGIEDLYRTLMMAKELKKKLAKPSLASRLYSALSRSTEMAPVDEESGEPLVSSDIETILGHAELVEAESSLLLAILRIFGEPDGLNYMTLLREVWTVRQVYIYFRQREACKESVVRTCESSALADDKEFHAGVLLGNGMLNVLFSMMPPSIYKVFSVIGYTGDGELGRRQLTECAESDTVRAPLAQIFLCLYYTVMCGTLTGNQNKNGVGLSVNDRLEAVQAIIDPCLAKNASSPVFLFFQGRAHFLRHDVLAAITAYEKANEQAETLWPAFQLVIHWDLVLGNMRQLDWAGGLKYTVTLATRSGWSRAFCSYLEIIFRAALVREGGSEEDREKLVELVEALPRLEKRIAGRAFPMERFAVTRCQAVNAGECELLYPDYELLTLWDGYAYMDESTLTEAEQHLTSFLSKDTLPTEWSALLTIALASVNRYQERFPESKERLQSILDEEAKMMKEAFNYTLPLAHVEMAATLLAMDRQKEARHHYNVASKWKHKHYLDRTIQVRCSKLALLFKK